MDGRIEGTKKWREMERDTRGRGKVGRREEGIEMVTLLEQNFYLCFNLNSED
jgi:hypothetical protein